MAFRIFIDTANVKEIKEAAGTGIIDEIATNPNKMSQVGRRYHYVIRDIRGLRKKLISLAIVVQMLISLMPYSGVVVNAHAVLTLNTTTVTDNCDSATSTSNVTYSGFSANNFTTQWNSSSPVCPDPTVLNIQSVASAYPGSGSPATVTYKANGATKVMVSAYSDVGTTAWDINYEGAYFRGYDTANAFDATKLLNVLIDPVDGKLYIHLPNGQYAVYSDWFYYRFYPCDGTRAYAVAPAVPSRLVPLGVGIQYSTDGTTWNYAAKQIVSSVKGGGTNNYYETWKALLPDGVKYVRVSLNERNTAYDADTGVQVAFNLGSYSTWSCGLASVEIDRLVKNITDNCTDIVSKSGMVYNGLGFKDFTSTWASTNPACPDGSILNISGTTVKMAGNVTYTVNGAKEVRVNDYSFVGTTAWDINWNNQYYRGYDNSQPFDASKLYQIMMDPADGDKLYVKLPDNQWALWADGQSGFYRAWLCNAQYAFANAPLVPSRLVPFGLSVEYSFDGVVWNMADKRILNSVRGSGAGINNFYETWGASLPDGVKYVRVGWNDRKYGYDVVGDPYGPNAVLQQVDLGASAQWLGGLAKISIDCDINPNNHAPITQDKTYQGYKDTAVYGSLFSYDADDDPLQLSITSNPVHGTLALDGTNFNFKYTPNAGWTGTDTIKYKAFDGISYSNEGTVTFNVSGNVPQLLPEDNTIQYPTVMFLTLPSVLSDGTVLQRDKPIKIWGADIPGKQVTVEIYDNQNNVIRNTSVTTNSDGSFMATFNTPISASFNKYKIVCSDDSTTKTINDVLFGDVWLSGGQSNMELQTRYIDGAQDLLNNANNSNIRFFIMPSNPAGGLNANEPVNPQFDIQEARWGKGNITDDVKLISGLSYTAILKLFGKLNTGGNNVPLAILNTSLGATNISAWTSRRTIEQSEYVKNFLIGYGRYDSRNTFNSKGSSNYNQTTAMFNSKIAPLTNMNIKGILWDQGENDVGDYAAAQCYKVELDMLMKDWSQWFGSNDVNLPFVFVQLAPYNYSYTPESLAYFWEGMSQAWTLNSQTSAQVPVYDLPLTWNNPNFPGNAIIHQIDKKPIGERMADALWGLAYDSSEYTAPVYKSMTINGDKLEVKFDHVGTGLKLKDGDSDFKGFTICGSDRVFVNARARIVDTDTVEVWSDMVKDPVDVTYAFTYSNYTANLYNSINIVAAPFRSNNVVSNYYNSKEFAHCDSASIWVDTGSVSNGGADFQPTWAINSGGTTAQNSMITFDTSKKSEGNASLKISYTANNTNNSVSVEPIISYLGTINNFNLYDRMSFDIYNLDGRVKTFQGVTFELNDGSKYTATIEGTSDTTKSVLSSSDVQTLTVSLNKLKDSNGNIITSANALLQNVNRMYFTFNDNQAGSINIDNIRFGTNLWSIRGSSYNISNDNILTKMQPGTTVDDCLLELKPTTNENIVFANSGSTISGLSKIGTGTTINITQNNVVRNYSVAIYGDIDGDGNIGIQDIAEVKLFLLKINTLSSLESKAADVSKNGTISISDLMIVKKQILGIVVIVQ